MTPPQSTGVPERDGVPGERAEHAMGPVTGAGAETARTAGCVCWRPAREFISPVPQVMLVRTGGEEPGRARAGRAARGRRADGAGDAWTWPVGATGAGETLPECAARYGSEAAGRQALLGVPLTAPASSAGEQPAQPVFWAARVARTGRRANASDDVRWVDAVEARDLLTDPHDLAPLDALLARVDEGTLDTRPVIVLRHARARPRDSWSRADGDRPLVSAGRRQALALAPLLCCWRPEHLLCSPWRRCTETLAPYAAASDTRVRVKGGLSEDGHARDPDKAARHLLKVLGRDDGSLICTHRKVLADLLPIVAALTDPQRPELAAAVPADDPYLAPAEALVLQVARIPGGGDDEVRVVSVEHHLPV